MQPVEPDSDRRRRDNAKEHKSYPTDPIHLVGPRQCMVSRYFRTTDTPLVRGLKIRGRLAPQRRRNDVH